MPIEVDQMLIRLNYVNNKIETFVPSKSLLWERHDLQSEYRFHNYKIIKAANRYFLLGGRLQNHSTSPCAEFFGVQKLTLRSFMLEQRDWCSAASLVKSDGQRSLYAIGGKTFSQVDLRSIECYNIDKDQWQAVKTKLNMKSTIFTSVQCFQNRYLYIMATDCSSIEVLDTNSPDHQFCTVIHLKMDFQIEDLMRPVLMPLNEDEIAFLLSQQDSESEHESSEQLSVSEHGFSQTQQFHGDFLFLASCGKNRPCPLMLLSVELGEIRPLESVIEWGGPVTTDRFSSQQVIKDSYNTFYLDGENQTLSVNLVKSETVSLQQ